MKNRTLHIVSLGCPKNQVDAEVMAAILAGHGFRITAEPQAAEVILINTCAFILPAREEAIDEIFHMARYKKTGALKHLVVTGCLPQRYGRALEKEIPEVDLFLGISEVPNIIKHISKLGLAALPGPRAIVSKPDFLMNVQHPRLLPPSTATAYLKIADGCSNRCAYCIIPTIRGKARSRHPDDILQEAAGLAEKGVKEIILIAQDTTAYGRDLKIKRGLSLLLQKLTAIEKIKWIRLLYAHPAHLTEDVLTIMAAEKKICRYIDIPIQHIDDAVLKIMNRRTGSKQIFALIEKARMLMPDIALRTSLMTGFPGETNTRFQRLVDLIRDVRFDHLGVFTYSREEGTPAAALSSRISEREKQSRRNLLMEEQAVISFQINRSLIGSRQECIVEGKSDRPDYPFYGRCRRQAPEIDGMTYFKCENLTIGEILSCTITDATEYDLFGEIV
ncbi:MAG: 30S ribosomal protein S12 methylthiotransferase RimO [Syntrophus sp. (in: bacteria)]|nr:30S ribosomal protein S12 methylthiotransferase RimO [Syntrophus sp. (in: bacteria)]